MTKQDTPLSASHKDATDSSHSLNECWPNVVRGPTAKELIETFLDKWGEDPPDTWDEVQTREDAICVPCPLCGAEVVPVQFQGRGIEPLDGTKYGMGNPKITIPRHTQEDGETAEYNKYEAYELWEHRQCLIHG